MLGLLAVLLLVAVSGAALAEDSDAKVGEAVPVVKPEEIAKGEAVEEPKSSSEQERPRRSPRAKRTGRRNPR